ncbi:MAG: hypothetical protein IJY42_03350 [Clostridia bacterium]|nr:hypothetical protein [Clostridia bacterium]
MIAIEKPLRAPLLSVSVALVFPALFLWFLLPLGLNGIWLNMAGTSFLSAIFGIVLLATIWHKKQPKDRSSKSEP